MCVTFWVKGSGTIHMYFMTKHVKDLGGDAWGSYGKNITLTGSWTKIVIDKADILADPDNTAITQTWDQASQFVSDMSFEVVGDPSSVTELYLDDIRFYGMTAIQ